MRHRVYGKHLSRNKDERDRLFKSLVSELILRGSIQTSVAKAKAIKGLVDRVINLAKEKNTQRFLQTYLMNKDLKERLVKEIVPKLGGRTSGYTSLMRMGTRMGDQTMMVKMSLIGAEELGPIKKVDVKKETVVGKKKARIKKPISKRKAQVKLNIKNKRSKRKPKNI